MIGHNQFIITPTNTNTIFDQKTKPATSPMNNSQFRRSNNQITPTPIQSKQSILGDDSNINNNKSSPRRLSGQYARRSKQNCLFSRFKHLKKNGRTPPSPPSVRSVTKPPTPTSKKSGTKPPTPTSKKSGTKPPTPSSKKSGGTPERNVAHNTRVYTAHLMKSSPDSPGRIAFILKSPRRTTIRRATSKHRFRLNGVLQPKFKPNDTNALPAAQIVNNLRRLSLMPDDDQEFMWVPDTDELDINSGAKQVQSRLVKTTQRSLISQFFPGIIKHPNTHSKRLSGKRSLTSEYYPGRLVYPGPVGVYQGQTLTVPEVAHAYNEYCSLVDWMACDHNQYGLIVLGHGNTCSILNAGTLGSDDLSWEISKPLVNNGIISSIRGCKDLTLTAIGCSDGTCYLIDTDNMEPEWQLDLPSLGQESLIGCMDWNPASPSVLAMGTREGSLIIVDRRSNMLPSIHVPQNHNVEVCSVAWHMSGHYLATGTGESLANVWDVRFMQGHVLGDRESNVISNVELSGRSRVKSVQWCPWMPNTIAAGGGNTDCTVVVWDVMNQSPLVRIGAQGPVKGIHWSEISRELVACTGLEQFSDRVPTAPGFKIWSNEHDYKHVESVNMPSFDVPNEMTVAYMQPVHVGWSPCGQVSVVVDNCGQLSFWRLFDKPSVLQKVMNHVPATSNIQEHQASYGVCHVDQLEGVDLAHFHDSSWISEYPIWPTTVSVPVARKRNNKPHRHPSLPYSKSKRSPLFR